MKCFFASTLLLFSTVAFARNPYSIVCESDKVTLNLRSDFQFRSSQNGWRKYWGTVDFVMKDGKKEQGSVPVDINLESASNVLIIGFMDPSEAAMKKSGLESGSIGFAGINSREKLEGQFKAEFQSWRPSEEIPALNELENHELTCQIQ